MKGFAGFPAGKLRTTPVPNLFFSDLLPIIDDLAELKVTLYAFWALTHQEGDIRYLRLVDFLGDPEFIKGMGENPTAAAEATLNALERAVARGTFLHISIEGADGHADLYFINSEKGRAAVDGITRGEWRPALEGEEPISLLVERPNIFVLYEQNIGALTPLIADELRDAEQTYPLSWIEEAIQIAVNNNTRKWRYVIGVLESWRQEGKESGTHRRGAQKESRQRIPDQYKGIIKR